MTLLMPLILVPKRGGRGGMLPHNAFAFLLGVPCPATSTGVYLSPVGSKSISRAGCTSFGALPQTPQGNEAPLTLLMPLILGPKRGGRGGTLPRNAFAFLFGACPAPAQPCVVSPVGFKRPRLAGAFLFGACPAPAQPCVVSPVGFKRPRLAGAFLFGLRAV